MKITSIYTTGVWKSSITWGHTKKMPKQPRMDKNYIKNLQEFQERERENERQRKLFNY